ncbi:hypothetical protein Dimus_027319, partial [Dionaea muscipula]
MYPRINAIPEVEAKTIKMNAQAHVSGQISSQVTTAGAQFHGLSRQNGNPLQAQMQNLGDRHNTLATEDLAKMRIFIRHKILEFLRRRPGQLNGMSLERISDLVKFLEYRLFKAAASKDEFMNLATLENRLLTIIKRMRLENQSAQNAQFVNSSP